MYILFALFVVHGSVDICGHHGSVDISGSTKFVSFMPF